MDTKDKAVTLTIELIMRRIIIIILTFFLLSFSGCMSWEEGWSNIPAPTDQQNIALLISNAEKLEKNTDSAEKLERVIAIYEQVLLSDPANRKALDQLSEYHFLMAFGYCEDSGCKKEHYLRQLRMTERAMYTNSEFKRIIDQGNSLWDSVNALTKEDMLPMLNWYCGVNNYWSECLGPVSKIFNIRWPFRSVKVLDRMLEIDPAWWGGHPVFMKGAYYSILPGFMGGNINKAAVYFDKAVNAGPEYFFPRWGRALYLYTKTGNRQGFIDDLTFIVKKETSTGGGLYAWNAFFKQDAEKLLKNIDNYFHSDNHIVLL